MAWLSDEEYTLRQENREKSITARSARHMRTHCGKSGGVKLPCDYMTKKELRAMNGKCESYRMNDPISWDEFKTWPDEHKITYIKSLREKYKVPTTALAKAMGVSEVTLRKWNKCLGLAPGKGSGAEGRHWHKTDDSIRFWAWWHGVKQELLGDIAESSEGADENASVEPLEAVEADICEKAESVEATEDNSCPEATESPVEAAFEKNCQNIEAARNSYPEVRDARLTPAIPSMGSMVFDCAADNALAVLENLLRHTKVKLTVTWEVVEDCVCHR